MKFIKGKNRNQLEFYCLEEAIEPNNEVRLIDLFAASLNLADYGFKTEFMANGRPACHPSDSFSPHTIYDAFLISRTKMSC